MPVIAIEAPAGLSAPKKKKLMHQVHVALEEAYGLGTTLTFLREYSSHNLAIDGVQLGSGAASERQAATHAHA